MSLLPFSFGKKIEFSKDYSIEQIPLFSSLSQSEQKLVEKKVRLVEFKKGDFVYEQGNEADAFYVIVSGRFRVFVTSERHEQRTITYFYRGDHFGEISILTGKPHSVTVEAKNDALVLKLSKQDFAELLKQIPSLSMHLSRLLGLRLRDESSKRLGEAKIISVYSLENNHGQAIFSSNLAVSLAKETKKEILYLGFNERGDGCFPLSQGKTEPMLFLDSTDLSKEREIEELIIAHPSGIKYLMVKIGESNEEEQSKKVTTLISYLIGRFSFMILVIPSDINSVIYKVLSQSDSVFLLSDSKRENLERAKSLIQEIKKSFGFTDKEIRFLLTEKERLDTSSIKHVEEIAECKIFNILPSVSENGDPKTDIPLPILDDSQGDYAHSLRYLAREQAGRLVGLALGSGSAYGLAHIGVLKVLEEEKIPIDIIAGSSIGSLMGTLWASGYSADQVAEIAKSLNRKNVFDRLVGLDDFSLAHQGFFKGRNVTKFIYSLLGDKTFRDLKIPVKIVATNLFTSEEIIFEEGALVEAIRASISIPGIFRPVGFDGKTLIDGGVVDPLPVKVLARYGVKKIIAVNVLSGPADFMKRKEVALKKQQGFEEEIKKKSPWIRWFYRAGNAIKTHYSSNIFNVLMNTIQFMEYNIASTATSEADVVIHPVVHDSHWAQFYSAEKFIRAGEEKTREQLEEIKRLIEE